jgi:exopolysaccharide biosynthesis protein
VLEFKGQLPSGRNVRAFCVVIDLSDKTLKVRSIPANDGKGLTTTSQLAKQHGALVAINGGFFTFRPDTAQSGLSSVSLLGSGGRLIAPDQVPLFRKDKQGRSRALYPTRGAFGLRRRRPDIAWAHASEGRVWQYASPNPVSDSLEQPRPTAKTPTLRKRWRMDELAGGGPVLVHDGKKRITDREELFTGNMAQLHPRTAVGYTRDRRLLWLVVDGRQASSEGANFDDLAEIFLGLGAHEALNLDGGGSTTLVVNGQIINQPSDKTGERPVASVLVVGRE